MNIEAALALADSVFFNHTGKHLSDLQNTILQGVWQGQKYSEIAEQYGCTEGHAKDVASLLWKQLSIALGEKVTKTNIRSILERNLLTKAEKKIFISFPPNDKFLGRENEIKHLYSLVHQGHKVIVIQGEGGIGKTTLAQQYFQHQEFDLILELLMAKETQNITSVESVLEEWLKKELQEEPGREFGITLARLKRHLESRKIGILIDNLEPALDAQGMFINSHGRYVELLRVLTDFQVQSVTLITSRDRLCEPTLKLAHYRLLGLDLDTWKTYFYTASISPNFSTLQTLHRTYGGNPKAMTILGGVIQTDFAGDIQGYWQETQDDPLSEIDLKNLVASQFDRLQMLDQDAYQLLCRLGCYRYQDISKVPKTALLALLWDVENRRHKRVIQSLNHRSLIEYNLGQYWLHPVIRAEAITRLRETPQWEETNAKAAQFWSESVKEILTLQDGITAWEALFHYLEIEDFERVSQVILQPRQNQWGQFLPLGSILYRMGLLQPVKVVISQIIEKVEDLSKRSELYNILGDLYWITGNIHRAIACQEEAINVAVKYRQENLRNLADKKYIYYLKMLEIDSLLSLGLYHIDLWELAKAIVFLNQVIQLAENTPHSPWAQKASVCLALVKSYLGISQEALLLANQIYLDRKLSEETGRFSYFVQILGQTYVNLGETEKATQLLKSAIAFSQQSHYPQVKAKALISLAEIDRQQQKLDLAITKQLEAINLLEEIGAKCDLAQAYYQLGLTQQCSRQNAFLSFQKAQQLFREIKAPKQIDKVQATAQNNNSTI